MKPVQIALLVVAGAIGGALVMKVMHKPKPAVVAQVEQPAGPAAPAVTPAAPANPGPASPAPAEAAPAVVTPPSPAPEPRAAVPATPAAPVRPSPFKARKEAVKPQRARARVVPEGNPEPVERFEDEVPPPAAAPAAPPPAPAAARSPAPEPEHVTPPPPPAAPPQVTLNAGMLIPVRLVDALSTERNAPGDTFAATLYRELVVDGFVIAERGARVEGRVVACDKGGKVKGTAAIALELTRLHTSDGQTVAIQSDSFERHAQAEHGTDAAKVGAGAVIGAVIGGIAGGGKGAAIGAGVGGGAGAGDVLLTRGKPVKLASETTISFRLRAPVTITEKR